MNIEVEKHYKNPAFRVLNAKLRSKEMFTALDLLKWTARIVIALTGAGAVLVMGYCALGFLINLLMPWPISLGIAHPRHVGLIAMALCLIAVFLQGAMETNDR